MFREAAFVYIELRKGEISGSCRNSRCKAARTFCAFRALHRQQDGCAGGPCRRTAELGVGTLTATSGSEGLRLLRSTAVHVVVLDYEMPEMNGDLIGHTVNP